MRGVERRRDERGRMIACREQVVGAIRKSRAGIDRNATYNKVCALLFTLTRMGLQLRCRSLRWSSRASEPGRSAPVKV